MAIAPATAPAVLEPPRTIEPLDTAAFTLDITVIEQGDYGGLVRLTEDGCGSTCGACTTG
jgi:FxLD family lantipeptide